MKVNQFQRKFHLNFSTFSAALSPPTAFCCRSKQLLLPFLIFSFKNRSNFSNLFPIQRCFCLVLSFLSGPEKDWKQKLKKNFFYFVTAGQVRQFLSTIRRRIVIISVPTKRMQQQQRKGQNSFTSMIFDFLPLFGIGSFLGVVVLQSNVFLLLSGFDWK